MAEQKVVPVPSWFIKMLAWGFVLTMISWATYIQAQADDNKKTDAKQQTEIEQVKTMTEQNLIWIRQSLNEIKQEVKE